MINIWLGPLARSAKITVKTFMLVCKTTNVSENSFKQQSNMVINKQNGK